MTTSQSVASLASVLFLIALSDAEARSPHSQNGSETQFVVPLQPFTLDPPVARAIPVATRVAYNAPRALPAPAPIPQTSDDDEEDIDQESNRDQNDDGADESTDRDVERHASGPTVPGSRAILRNGIAYAPARAPWQVKQAIWAANGLRRKPYTWGGGHGSFYDRGYDCSGSVSFALHAAGVLSAPLPSEDLMRFGKRGRGRWITIYSRNGHTFAEIAGLRFDTTDLGRGGDVGPRWYTTGRNTRGFVARHPAGF